MLLGPVFRAELIRAARRGRDFALRAAYGALLLAIIGGRDDEAFRDRGTVPIAAMARFAEDMSVAFAVVQLATVLLLIPPLFGGAIADETPRRTLHFLMATRHSAGEVVLDKVLGRAPHLLVFLAIGLPVVCLLGLFGGIPAEYVAVAYAGTASSATLAVALTILVSTLARRVRQAVLVAYLLVLAWVFLPAPVDVAGSQPSPATFARIGPILGWLAVSSAFGIWLSATARRWSTA